MAELKWFDEYAGQSIDQLLALEGQYRTDSIVVAIQRAIGHKAAQEGAKSLTPEEQVVLAVDALAREVHYGGFAKYFANAPTYAPIVVASLTQIQCPKTAEVCQEAIDALDLPVVNVAEIHLAVTNESARHTDILQQCDRAYHETGEDIEGSLFAYIKKNRDNFKF